MFKIWRTKPKPRKISGYRCTVYLYSLTDRVDSFEHSHETKEGLNEIIKELTMTLGKDVNIDGKDKEQYYFAFNLKHYRSLKFSEYIDR